MEGTAEREATREGRTAGVRGRTEGEGKRGKWGREERSDLQAGVMKL